MRWKHFVNCMTSIQSRDLPMSLEGYRGRNWQPCSNFQSNLPSMASVSFCEDGIQMGPPPTVKTSLVGSFPYILLKPQENPRTFLLVFRLAVSWYGSMLGTFILFLSFPQRREEQRNGNWEMTEDWRSWCPLSEDSYCEATMCYVLFLVLSDIFQGLCL